MMRKRARSETNEYSARRLALGVAFTSARPSVVIGQAASNCHSGRFGGPGQAGTPPQWNLWSHSRGAPSSPAFKALFRASSCPTIGLFALMVRRRLSQQHGGCGKSGKFADFVTCSTGRGRECSL